MSEFLIAVSSCQHDRAAGDHEAIRQTWGRVAQESGVDYIITIGGPRTDLWPNEAWADVPDDWNSLWLKTIHNVRYASERGYRYVFQCFKDTYISIPRLARAYSELTAPIVGNYFFHGIEEGHPCGGSGYWMDRRCMDVITKLSPGSLPDYSHAEDGWIQTQLDAAGLYGFHDSRYDHLSMRGGVSRWNTNITNHLWSHYQGYQQDVMGFREWNRDWLRQEQHQEVTGELSEQNIRRRELSSELKRRAGWR